MCADAILAERGEIAVSCQDYDELRSLAASGSDSAELAQETADLIALLHQARSSNTSVSAAQHVVFGMCKLHCACSLQPSLCTKLCLRWHALQHACFACYVLHAHNPIGWECKRCNQTLTSHDVCEVVMAQAVGSATECDSSMLFSACKYLYCL